MDGTRRRRLVIKIGTRSTNTHEVTMWLLQWVTVVVRPLIRGNAIAHVVLVPHSASQNPSEKRPGRCVLNEFSHSLPCSRTVTRAAAAVDLHKGVSHDRRCVQKLRARAVPDQKNKEIQAMASLFKNCAHAQWPLRREAACVLTENQGQCSCSAVRRHDGRRC